MRKQLVLFFIFITIFTAGFAQQISYTQPEQQDSRSLNFQIIGKIHDNFLIYKNIRNDYAVCSYDNSMKLLNRINMTFMPDNTLNVDFVLLPDFAYMIYQYQKKNVLYCKAVKINDEGKLLSEPISLDTTHLNFFANNKIYSLINSEDKSKIMVYKIRRKSGKFNFTTLLYNDSLQLLHKSDIQSYFDDKKDYFSDFFVDNDGNFVFTKGYKSGAKDYIQDLSIVVKEPDADTLGIYKIDLQGNLIDPTKVKIDNLNKNYIINSLYYTRKRGNVEGIFTAVWNRPTKELLTRQFQYLGDTVRAAAKSNGNNKSALDDYFIRDIILKKDGGFILSAEDFYSQSRGNPWNRYNYMYDYPMFSPFNYYTYPPYYGYYPSGGFGGYPFYNNMGDQRFYYNNVLVVSMDKTGKVDWGDVIQKSQYDDQSDNYLSYIIMLTGGQMHYLYNRLERRTQFLTDISISGSGKVTRNPPLKGLDRGYQFMPRYGKQVSASQIIIPCIYRNYICFAKIEFP